MKTFTAVLNSAFGPVLSITAFTALVATQAASAMEMGASHFSQVKIDQLEVRDAAHGTVAAWDVQAWYGADLNKLYFYSEGERLLDEGGRTESHTSRLAWSHAITAFWDTQLSLRRDWQPDTPNRDWLGIGLQGLAPYFFETSAHVFIGESGLTELRLKTEYDLLLTQRLILSPELEASLYGKDDPDNGIGAGLTRLEGGLRLRYEIRREFAPYIGVHWERQYGGTADNTRAAGGDTEDTALVAGIRAWF